MADDLLKRQRYAQSERELKQLRGEIDEWCARRTKADTHKQYVTQLTALGERFEAMLGLLEGMLGEISLTGSTGEVYAACRDADTRLLWIRRVYQWYATKFNQRDDTTLQDVLAAADEIVWSCYAQPFRALKQKPPPVPLPFVDPTFSPFAIPRVMPPTDLLANVHSQELMELLNELPVPVVAFPPNCLEQPWWLAFLAHEVGHHVYFDLLPDTGLVTTLPKDIKDAGVHWPSWHHEMFADLYSVLMIGPWGSWALSELVWGTDVTMLDDTNARYPAPLTRLMFMAEVAQQLKVDPAPALRGLEPDDLLAAPPSIPGWPDRRDSIRKDNGYITGLVETLLTKVKPNGKKLATLCEFDAGEFNDVADAARKKPKGDVPLWADALRGKSAMKVRQDLRSVRVLLASAVQAWSQIVEIADDDLREQQRVQLKTEMLSKIVKSREEVTREAEKTTVAPGAEAAAPTNTESLVKLFKKLSKVQPGLS